MVPLPLLAVVLALAPLLEQLPGVLALEPCHPIRIARLSFWTAVACFSVYALAELLHRHS